MPNWPETSRAAVLRDYGRPLTVEDVRLPDRLEPGSAIVRVDCCTLCGSDVHAWEGKLSTRALPLPIVLGHEIVGTLVGLELSNPFDILGNRLAVGDRIGWSEASCGHCYECSVLGQPTQCAKRQYGILQTIDQFPFSVGGLSEYCYLPPGSARMRIPDDMPSKWAAAAGCALKTVVRAFDRAGGVRTGARVVIQGSGALGLFGVAVARTLGAQQVIVVGGPTDRLSVARAYGATEIIDVAEVVGAAERVTAVRELTDGRGADLVCDFAGARTSTAEGIEMTARHGVHLVVGQTTPTDTPIAAQLVMTRELTLIGTSSGNTGNWFRGLEFMQWHRESFDWDLLFHGPYPLDRTMDAMEAMASYSVTKAVVEPSLVVNSRAAPATPA